MNRLAELLGPDIAQRLAAEFRGQAIYFRMEDAHALRDQIRRDGAAPQRWTSDELRETGRVVDRGDGFLELERTPEESAAVDAAILAEFNGINHCQLARHYRVSVQWVYRLVRQAQREAAAAALRATVEGADEVLWVAPVTQLALLPALEAVTLVAERAKARGRLDSLAVALVLLPPAHPQAAPAGNPPPAAAPAENRPAPQDRDANPPPAAP